LLGTKRSSLFCEIGKFEEERFYNFGLRNHQGLASSHTTMETVTKENFLTGKDKVSIFQKWSSLFWQNHEICQN
jgi:hypothetical protein